MDVNQRLEWLEQRMAALETELDLVKRRQHASTTPSKPSEALTERTDREEIQAILARRKQSKDTTTSLVRNRAVADRSG